MTIDENYLDSIRKKIERSGSEQLGYLCRDINLYELVDKTSLGKSLVGKEMDEVGRWMFNHRFGGGHLWWKELRDRPINEWKDVVEHLASDCFTKAGLPYAFDGSMLKENKNLLKCFSKARSSENWGMINGFEIISGAGSLIFSIYDAKHLKYGYHNDIAFAMDNMFIGLNIGAGIATCNPFLIVAAFIKSSTVVRKFNRLPGIECSSPYDVSVDSIIGLNRYYDVNVDQLIGMSKTFDFYYDDKIISLNNI